MSPSALKKAVLVTGHTGGIGTAILEEFNSAGIAIVGLDTTPSTLQIHAEHIVDLGEMLDNYEQWSATIKETLSDIQLLGLINCAANQTVKLFDDLSHEDIEQSLKINVLAPYALTKICYEALAKTVGCVINIGSIHSQLSKAGFLSYSVSKAAFSGLTRALSIELGRDIRVLEINPAAIATPMLEAGFAGKSSQRQKLDEYHPTGEIGKPEDVAKLCLLLIENPLPYLNGSSINFDGGISNILSDPSNERE